MARGRGTAQTALAVALLLGLALLVGLLRPWQSRGHELSRLRHRSTEQGSVASGNEEEIAPSGEDSWSQEADDDAAAAAAGTLDAGSGEDSWSQEADDDAAAAAAGTLDAGRADQQPRESEGGAAQVQQQEVAEGAAEGGDEGRPDEAPQQEGEAGAEGEADASPADALQQEAEGGGTEGQPDGLPAYLPQQKEVGQEGKVQAAAGPTASAAAGEAASGNDASSSVSEEPGSESALPTPEPEPEPEPVQVEAAGNGTYRPSLQARQLRKGIVSQGDPGRARRAAAKLLAGEPIAVAFVGGSVTFGAYSGDPARFGLVAQTFAWLNATFPHPSHRLVNAAVPATPSSYMSLCSAWHIPEEADLVFVEYNVNDGREQYTSREWEGELAGPMRLSHERLLRKLLVMRNRPAVVELVVYRWPGISIGDYYEGFDNLTAPYRYYNGDDELGVLAQFYHIPWLSGRSLLWNLATARDPKPGHAWKEFQANLDHPNALGHKYYADLAIAYIQQVVEDVKLQPLEAADEEEAQEELPPPMYKGNWAAKADSCWMAQRFKQLVVKHDEGWEFVNEGTGQKPKWGWVSTQPGASMEIVVNTKLALSDRDQPTTSLAIAHLKSYQRMGQAGVVCLEGCTCEGIEFDGHQGEQNSQTHISMVEVSAAEACRIRVTVLNGTSSGGHKVKVSGVIVSEVPGWSIADGQQPLPVLFGGASVVWDDSQH